MSLVNETLGYSPQELLCGCDDALERSDSLLVALDDAVIDVDPLPVLEAHHPEHAVAHILVRLPELPDRLLVRLDGALVASPSAPPDRLRLYVSAWDVSQA